MRPVVGFDLDLTLVDSADGIVATFVETGRRLGVTVDAEGVRATIGVPLEDAMARFVPAHLADDGVRVYRELYPTLGVTATTLMPGAVEAVAAVHAHGGRAIVVSAKIKPAVEAVLEHVGLDVDDAFGGLYAEAKGAALRTDDAVAHVGDHPADMIGATAAGAVAIGVTTGSHDATALRAAGADVVLADLLDFPHWLDEFVLDSRLKALDEHLAGSGRSSSRSLAVPTRRSSCAASGRSAPTGCSPRPLSRRRCRGENCSRLGRSPATSVFVISRLGRTRWREPGTAPTTATAATSARPNCSMSSPDGRTEDSPTSRRGRMPTTRPPAFARASGQPPNEVP